MTSRTYQAACPTYRGNIAGTCAVLYGCSVCLTDQKSCISSSFLSLYLTIYRSRNIAMVNLRATKSMSAKQGIVHVVAIITRVRNNQNFPREIEVLYHSSMFYSPSEEAEQTIIAIIITIAVIMIATISVTTFLILMRFSSKCCRVRNAMSSAVVCSSKLFNDCSVQSPHIS